MLNSYPEPIILSPEANNKRIYLIIGLFLMIILVIVIVFFKDEIKNLIIGHSDIEVNNEEVNNEEVNNDEVYNIGKNIYTYDEANNLCNSLNAKLASHDQVVNAYKKGAEWCNYGWSKGQNALFPIQKDTWEELQRQPENYKNICGNKYGVNGGFFENNRLRFGVNCYGIKPHGNVADGYRVSILKESSDNIKKLNKKEINKLGIKPFNEIKWSEHN